MLATLKRGKLGDTLLVIAPLLALSAIFLFVLYMFVSAYGLPPGLNAAGIVLAAVAYFASIALLSRFGITRVNRLEHLSSTDSLTGMPNRRALHAHISKNAEADQEVAIALIDLDGFKLINDQYSHFVGDDLLKTCAAMLKEHCGSEAQCFRLGGDEFAIAKQGAMAGTILEGICRTLIDRLATPMQVEDRHFAIGASIGLSRAVANSTLNSTELLRQADIAMYASKRGGKMRCTWYSADLDRTREARRELDSELRLALENEEFQLHYQPLVDAQTREVVAVESLLRWSRPSGEAIGPHIFIPVAEESGLINAIGLWVLRQACTDALKWDTIKLSINISAAQLRNPEFPIHLGEILEETGFPPERLELEITETSLVLDPVVAERSLAVIRGFGVDVALDDFGTGYASIGFLRQFRFEKLKLDRSLITEAGNDEGSRAMMLSSITVARAMKMAVTAEGVETEEQAAMVKAAGCDQIQGWLFFKAMPAEQISEHLPKNSNTDTNADGAERKSA